MIVVYRHGTFGHYIERLTTSQYNWSFGNLAWSGCYSNESMWMVPGTVDPDTYVRREYSPELGR